MGVARGVEMTGGGFDNNFFSLAALSCILDSWNSKDLTGHVTASKGKAAKKVSRNNFYYVCCS